MTLDQAIEYAIDGSSVLFLGSGFAREAEDIKGNKLKSGPELAKYLSDLCNAGEPLPLDQAAELYLDMFGEDELIDTVKKLFTVRKVAANQLVFPLVGWKRIYTTNYDRVIETAYVRQQKILTPVTMSDNPRKIDFKSVICLHLNGIIDRLNRDTINGEFKLTNTIVND